MGNLLQNKYFQITGHILFWLLFTLIPIGLASDMQMDFAETLRHSLVRTFSFAAIFYFNYLWLIDNYFIKKKNIAFVFINLLFIIMLLWVKSLVIEDRPPQPPPINTIGSNIEPKPRDSGFIVYLDFLLYLIPIAFAVTIKTTNRLSAVQLKQANAEKNILQYELQYLKYQLQPHFFFNALNNIYSLIDLDSETAKASIHNLGKLMRYMLYRTDVTKVELREEITFIEQYIKLMQLRMRKSTSIQVNFPDTVPLLKIAPLLFISIVENAFKHGVSATQPSELIFTLKTEGSQVIFFSENTNFPKTDQDKSGSGIGIENLEKRLYLLYPNRFKFTNEVKNDRYYSTLWIETQEG
ncbi:MAG: sensor histidine kinase [Aestuariibaculum sp.]